MGRKRAMGRVWVMLMGTMERLLVRLVGMIVRVTKFMISGRSKDRDGTTAADSNNESSSTRWNSNNKMK